MMDEQRVVPFRATRGTHFTEEQKWLLLVEYDKCLERGSKSAFCRRVGIDPVTPRQWVAQRADGRLMDPATVEDMKDDKQREKLRLNWDERRELDQLRRRNTSLEQKLEQSEAAVDVLGKAAALLEALAKSANNETSTTQTQQPGRPGWLSDPDTSKLPLIPRKNS